MQQATVNLINVIAEKLSETGVPFRADAWENAAPANYGVVVLTGQNGAEWADGRMIDQAFTADVFLYVSGGSQKWLSRVQEKLDALEAGYALPQRQYLPDIKKTEWLWRATFYGPLEWTAEA